MSRLMHRLGALCVRRKWVVVAVWVVVVLLVGAAVYHFGRVTTNDITLPGTGYQASADMLREEFPPQQNGASPIVFHVESGKLTDPANKKAIEQTLAAIEAMPETYSVFSPFAQGGDVFLSEDEKTAVAQVLLTLDWGQLDKAVARKIMLRTEPATAAGIQVEAGGGIGARLAEQTDRRSEAIGLLAAMVIMAFTFGALVAAGMPVITALVGLVVGLGLVGLLGHVTSIPNVAPTLATMVGLGVGIDYALFIVFRHRDQIHRGMDVDESIALAMATSGSAVVFAGLTVIVALLALLVARVPLLGAMGYAAALTVAVAVLTAITLLPAVHTLSVSCWADDPALRAFFVAPEEIVTLLAAAENLRALFAERLEIDTACVVLGMAIKTQRGFGMALQGDTVQRDVAQVSVSFSDHKARLAAADEAALRRVIGIEVFEYLVAQAMAAIGAERAERQELQRDRSLMRARLKLLQQHGPGLGSLLGEAPAGASEQARLEAELLENEQQLQAVGDSHDALPGELDCLVDVLANPHRYIEFSPQRLRLNRMNVMVEADDGDGDPVSTIDFCIVEGKGVPLVRRAFVLARVDRDQLPPSPRIDFAAAAAYL